MADLAPIPEDDLSQFSKLFDHSSNLRDILSKLPGHIVLESGLSAKRKSLINSWDELESPDLDGVVSSSAFESMNKWIHEAELTISHVVNLVKERSQNKLSLPKTEFEPEFEVVSDISDLEFVSDQWSWPWPKKQSSKKISKEGAKKSTLIKYGVFASLGAIAIISFLDEEE